MPAISKSQFVGALRKLPRPNVNQRAFLRAHYDAPGRVLTATTLSEVTTYKDYRGVNRWYGELARRVGGALGEPETRLSLSVEFVQPNALTNQHWLLVMRPEFAEAIKEVGWI